MSQTRRPHRRPLGTGARLALFALVLACAGAAGAAIGAGVGPDPGERPPHSSTDMGGHGG